MTVVMSEPVVAIDGLWKQFGDVSAVEDLSFTVERGEVCGLLGPNGAGKTTTLRVLLGLERASRGAARLFGSTVRPGCRDLARLGALVEEAAFVPHLTGMTNLRLWSEAAGGRLRDGDVDGALAIAGLGDAILIKNNHLALLGDSEAGAAPRALELAWSRQEHAAFIEVEVRSLEAARSAAEIASDSETIWRVIGRQGASILVRVMGIILCSLAVEIVLTALRVGDWTAVAPR